VNRAYFLDYCGRGDYDAIYREHSGVSNCIERMRSERARVRSVLVLGAATGRVLEDFERAFGVRPFGCELSRYAHARIPARFRGRVRRADLRSELPRLARAGRRFDLLFTSALVYLAAPEIRPALRVSAELARWFHFYASTREDFEPNDPARVTLRTRAWWRAQFLAAGWRPTRSRYLWRHV
jgi:hypothetical protein